MSPGETDQKRDKDSNPVAHRYTGLAIVHSSLFAAPLLDQKITIKLKVIKSAV